MTEARQLDDAVTCAFAHDGPALAEVMIDADLPELRAAFSAR